MPLASGADPKVTAICGGMGGARFALAMAGRPCTYITNVGDDWTVGGLKVCPDTDAVLYALAGLYDEERGWGVRGDDFPGPRVGEPEWFGLGVRDRAHHEERTRLLAAGHDLASATDALRVSLGLSDRVIPATSDPLPTRVVTDDGCLAFQEWLVRDRALATVRGVEWPDTARATPKALEAICDCDVLVVTSSSPAASIEPSLHVKGVLEAVKDRREMGSPTVLISPIVHEEPPHIPRDVHRATARARLAEALAIEMSPAGLAEWAAPWATHMILDPADATWADSVRVWGPEPLIAPILDQSTRARDALIDVVLRARTRSA